MKQQAQVFAARLVAFELFGGIEQPREAHQVRHALAVDRQVPVAVAVAVAVAESQRALAQVVAGTEQEVDLRKRARLPVGFLGALELGPSHETSTPSVRRTVGHRSEEGMAEGRLVLSRVQWQSRIELIGVRRLQVAVEIAERGRFALPAAMCPEPSGRDVLAGDLHVHPDRLLSHRRSAASDAHDAEAPGRSAAARCH